GAVPDLPALPARHVLRAPLTRRRTRDGHAEAPRSGNGRNRAVPCARREEDGLEGLLRIRWECGFQPDPPFRHPPAERFGPRPSLQRHPERRPLDSSVLRWTRILLRPKHRTLARLRKKLRDRETYSVERKTLDLLIALGRLACSQNLTVGGEFPTTLP